MCSLPGLLALFFFEPEWSVRHFVGYGMAALGHRGELGEVCYRSGGRVRCEEFSEGDASTAADGGAAIGAWLSAYGRDPQVVEENSIAILSDRPSKHLPELAEALGKTLAPGRAHAELPKVFDQLEGADLPSFVALTSGGEVVAWRTRSGLTPLVVGGYGFDMVVVSSESSAIEVLDSDVRKSLAPGEGVYVSSGLVKVFRVPAEDRGLCLFELLYLARHDSQVDGVSVYEFRRALGRELGKYLEGPVDAVIGVPETAIPYAIGLSQAAGARYELGFVTTTRRVRSMMKGCLREKVVAVHLKLNPIRSALEGRRVAIVDDSMVTGVTLKTVSQVLRYRIGVSEVLLFVASPKIVNSCPYGVMRLDRETLIAANLDEPSMRRFLEVDSLSWLSEDDVIKVSRQFGVRLCGLCFGLPPRGGEP